MAVIGVLGALLGALIGGGVTYITTRDQADETRSAEARTRRADAYTELLAASGVLRRAEEAPCPRNDDDPSQNINGEDFACAIDKGHKITAAEAQYRRDAVDVFVYGSDPAVEAEGGLAAILLTTDPLTPGAVLVRPRATPAEYEGAYAAFERVMCREVSADPRAGCRDP